MFQQETQSAENLNQILNKELDSFKAVLQFSEKIVDQIETLPISVLYKMVEFRQQWIDKIQKLEEFRNKLTDQKVDETDKEIIKDISALAEQLVKIDERIYKQLRERKTRYIKQHADLITARRQNRKDNNGYSRVMDIIQE